MSARPAKLCKLTKGQLIDAQAGFVDTFNWMVDFINHLRCSKDSGLKVDTTISDWPEIKPDANNAKAGDEVVTHVDYDAATHAFTQYKRKLASSVKFADKKATPSTVFVATEIDI